MAAESIPRGTPLNLEAKHVSVLSYNLLAPAFVRPIDLRTGAVQSYAAFEWVSEEDLIWENRQKKLLEQLRRWSADVVCLQEVQFDTEENGSFSLPAWLKNLDGYAACLPGDKYLTQMAERNERVLANRVAIGCAVLFRSDRLVQREETARSDPNRLVSACLEGHPESGIRHLGRTAFFSVHLDAQSEEERVEQLRKCLEKARALGTRDAVFAGDMNAECFPGSCVRAIISPEVPSAEEMARQCAAALRIAGTDDAEEQTETKESTESAEPTAQQLEQWKVLWDKAAQAPKEYRMCLQRVPTGPTRSAYDHGMSEGPCVTWSLDHIFYSPRTLKLLSRWTALEADPESSARGLPNAENPSDHLPVAALFEVFPTPCLEGSSRQSLLERLEKLEEQQHREMAELEEQLKALEPIETESQGPKGKKKDSPEMIAFKQEKRRKTKELKALQMVQRKDFWGNLSDLELDLVEESCGSTWIETGVRVVGIIWCAKQDGPSFSAPVLVQSAPEVAPISHKSKYAGVTWHPRLLRWQVHVRDPDMEALLSLGLFYAERDAAQAYDCAMMVLEGEDAAVNFPVRKYSRTEIATVERSMFDDWAPRPSARFLGVYKTRNSKMWRAEIEIFDKKQFLGSFNDEEEAARAVDRSIRSTGADKATQLRMLNFLEETDYFDDLWDEERAPRGGSSRFLGVSYHQASGLFLARLGRRHLGLFDEEDEAARAFDEASLASNGRTNFKPPES